jgi:hypothetical protein
MDGHQARTRGSARLRNALAAPRRPPAPLTRGARRRRGAQHGRHPVQQVAARVLGLPLPAGAHHVRLLAPGSLARCALERGAPAAASHTPTGLPAPVPLGPARCRARSARGAASRRRDLLLGRSADWCALRADPQLAHAVLQLHRLPHGARAEAGEEREHAAPRLCAAGDANRCAVRRLALALQQRVPAPLGLLHPDDQGAHAGAGLHHGALPRALHLPACLGLDARPRCCTRRACTWARSSSRT